MSVVSLSQNMSRGAASVGEATRLAHRGEHPQQAHGPGRGADAKPPAGRNALIGALSEALAALMPPSSAVVGADAATSAAAGIDEPEPSGSDATKNELKHALHEFTHELFNALRPPGGEDGGKGSGRGFAWGRTSLGDLSQRLEGLAQSLAGTPPASSPAAGALVPAVEVVSATADNAGTPPLPEAAGPVETPEVSDLPPSTTPATPPTPSAPPESPLLAAFIKLASSMSGGTRTDSAPASPADQLGALLRKMSDALHSAPGSELPAPGSLIDIPA